MSLCRMFFKVLLPGGATLSFLKSRRVQHPFFTWDALLRLWHSVPLASPFKSVFQRRSFHGTVSSSVSPDRKCSLRSRLVFETQMSAATTPTSRHVTRPNTYELKQNATGIGRLWGGKRNVSICTSSRITLLWHPNRNSCPKNC